VEIVGGIDEYAVKQIVRIRGVCSDRAGYCRGCGDRALAEETGEAVRVIGDGGIEEIVGVRCIEDLPRCRSGGLRGCRAEERARIRVVEVSREGSGRAVIIDNAGCSCISASRLVAPETGRGRCACRIAACRRTKNGREIGAEIARTRARRCACRCQAALSEFAEKTAGRNVFVIDSAARDHRTRTAEEAHAVCRRAEIDIA